MLDLHKRARIASQLNAAPEIRPEGLRTDAEGHTMTKVLDMLEERRVKCLNSHNLRIRLGMLLGLGVAAGHYSLFEAGRVDPMLSLQVGVGAFACIGIWAFQPLFSYRKAYKTEFICTICDLL